MSFIRRDAPKTRSFRQRLYGVLGDLADLEASRGDAEDASIMQPEDITVVLNKWTIDPHIELHSDSGTLGDDTLKLMEGIRLLSFDEADITELVEAKKKLFEQWDEQMTVEVHPVDQLDLMVHELEHELEATSAGVAYITAYLDNDISTAHDIIDEEGCTLVHVLTSWMLGYMMSRDTLPETGDDVQAIKTEISRHALETAQLGSMSHPEKRSFIKGKIEDTFGGTFDEGEPT